MGKNCKIPTSQAFTNKKTASNRAFYDSLMREVVCAIYDEKFIGINPDLEHPFYTKYHGHVYKPTNQVLSDKHIREIQEICRVGHSLHQRDRQHFSVRDFLLLAFPKITQCDLMATNEMQCTISQTTTYL